VHEDDNALIDGGRAERIAGFAGGQQERHARKGQEVKAEGKYEVAKEQCESKKDGASACKKEAKANYDKAKADIKAKHAKADAKRDTTASTGATRENRDNTPNRDLNRNGR